MLGADSVGVQVGELINGVIIAAGGVCALGFAVWLGRAGRWRRPLAAVHGSGDGPATWHVFLVLLAYLVFALLFGLGFRPFVNPQQVDQPGTGSWHFGLLADSLAKLVAVAMILVILRRHPPFAEARGPGWLRTLALGLLAGLGVTAVCTLQLSMTTVLWQWLYPEQVPPVHPALLALQESAWGGWGRAQVALTAVLVAPLAEEACFRGLLLDGLWRATRHAWLSILIAGLAFGFIHLSQPQDVLPLCTMGVVLGFVRLRTRSLAVCFVAHAVFNARTIVLALFFPELLETV